MYLWYIQNGKHIDWWILLLLLPSHHKDTLCDCFDHQPCYRLTLPRLNNDSCIQKCPWLLVSAAKSHGCHRLRSVSYLHCYLIAMQLWNVNRKNTPNVASLSNKLHCTYYFKKTKKRKEIWVLSFYVMWSHNNTMQLAVFW